MSKQLYDVIFNFGFNDAISDDYVIFTALTPENVESLFGRLNNYAEVPEYSFYNPTTDYYVTLDRVKGAYLTFRIIYSSTQKYSVDEMLSTLNNTLVEFIKEETKVEGFL